MNNQDKIKSIIYSIFGFIVAIIIIRLLLEVIGANKSAPFVSFWLNMTDIFVYPWEGMFDSIRLGSRSFINISGFIAALMYLAFGLALEQGIEEINTSGTGKLLYVIVNGVFKILEFVVGMRLFLFVLSASANSLFSRFIYDFYSFLSLPFSGILGGTIFADIFTNVLILVIIVIIDIAFDNVVRSILEKNDKEKG